MTDTTARLALPHILTNQAQQEVTHNEALALLDALVHLAVQDRDLAVPAGQPCRWRLLSGRRRRLRRLGRAGGQARHHQRWRLDLRASVRRAGHLGGR